MRLAATHAPACRGRTANPAHPRRKPFGADPGRAECVQVDAAFPNDPAGKAPGRDIETKNFTKVSRLAQLVERQTLNRVFLANAGTKVYLAVKGSSPLLGGYFLLPPPPPPQPSPLPVPCHQFFLFGGGGVA